MRRSSQVLPSSISEVDVYFGSLSGTAARLAATLARDVAALGVNTTLQSLEHFDPHRFTAPDSLRASTRACVFVVSTQFAGSVPPNAEVFYDWLKAASTSKTASFAKESLRTATSTNQDTSTALTTPSVNGNAAKEECGSACPLQQLVNWGRDLSKSRSDRSRSLKDVQFAVFGVDSSEYLTFNAVGKFVDARLRVLGGTRLCPLGLGDIASNLDATFLDWRARFLLLLPKMPGSIRLVALEDDLLLAHTALQQQQQWDIEWVSMKQLRLQGWQKADSHSNATSHYTSDQPRTTQVRSVVVDRFNKPMHLRFRCRIISAPARRTKPASQPLLKICVASRPPATPSSRMNLHTRRPNASLHSITLIRSGSEANSSSKDNDNSSDAQATTDDNNYLNESVSDVAIVRIALFGEDLKYQVADTFGLLPYNSAESVEQVAAALDFDLDSWIQLYSETAKPYSSGQQQQQQLPFATPCTVRTALTQYLEINSVTREFVRMASGFVSNDSEREVLEALASTDGSADFAAQIAKQNRGVLELVSLAPSLRIPFEVFVNITPLIKPRLFSIATSPLRHPHHIELAVDLGHPGKKQGVTATFLRRHAKQHMDSKATTTCMLRGFVVRSGFKTPVDPTAPMVLIADGTGIAPMRALLEHRRAEHRAESSLPPRNLLFYGCNDRASMLFAEDLFAMEQEGFLTLRLAFLSDASEDSRRIQNVVAKHLDDIAALVTSSRDSRIFVAGESAAVKGVHQVFQMRASPRENGNWYEEAVKSGRFVHDIF